MKSSPLWITIATHVIVGAYGYWLGTARMASEQALTFSYQKSSSILPKIRSQGTSNSSPIAAPNPDALSSPLPHAMAGSGFRGRLDRWMDATESMEAVDVLAYLQSMRHRPVTSDGLMAQQLLLARYAELDPETALS